MAAKEKDETEPAGETDKGLIAPDFDDDFNTWLEAAGVGSKNYTVHNYLHQIYPDKTQKYKKTWHNYFPTLDEIGTEFGGGKFKLVCQVLYGNKKKKGTETTFYIDDCFNEIKAAADAEKIKKSTGAGSGYLPGPLSSGMNDAAQIVALVESLLRTAAAAKPQNDNAGMFKLMNGIAEDQLRQNFRLVNKVRGQLLNNMAEDADFSPAGAVTVPPEPPNPMLEMVCGLVEEYAPKLLGGGPAAEGIIKTVKNLIGTPAIQPIINDPTAMRKIISTVNAKHGPDETRRLFAMIGIKL